MQLMGSKGPIVLTKRTSNLLVEIFWLNPPHYYYPAGNCSLAFNVPFETLAFKKTIRILSDFP